MFGIRIKRELRDDNYAAADILKRPVGVAFVILEYAQNRYALSDLVCGSLGVAVRYTQQHKQSPADLGDTFTVYCNRSLGYALQPGFHAPTLFKTDFIAAHISFLIFCTAGVTWVKRRM